MALTTKPATVLMGTCQELATAPQLAEYSPLQGPASTDFDVLYMLAVAASLSPNSSQALAESWALRTQFALGGDYEGDHDSGLGFGSLTVQMLNPNGVPASFSVELWLYSGPHAGLYNAVVYEQGGFPGGYYLELRPAADQVDSDFRLALHAALHLYPTALAVML